MRGWVIGIVAMLASGAVLADLEIGEVVYDPDGGVTGRYEAEVTNHYDRSIARFSFRLLATTPGREVPWHDSNYTARIPGGIEPGETYRLPGSAPFELLDAEGLEVVIEIFPLSAYAVDGSEIK